MENPDNKSVSIMRIAEELEFPKTTVGYVTFWASHKNDAFQIRTAQRVWEMAKRLIMVPHLLARIWPANEPVLSVWWSVDSNTNGQPMYIDAVLRFWREGLFTDDFHSHVESWTKWMWVKDHPFKKRRGNPLSTHPQSRQMYENIYKANIPLVFICDTLQEIPHASYVVWDCAPAAQIAVEHLDQNRPKENRFIGSTLIQLNLSLLVWGLPTDTEGGGDYRMMRILWNGQLRLPSTIWLDTWPGSNETVTEDQEIQLLLKRLYNL